MSNLSEQAVINLTIADYANVDNGGKANLVGVVGGIIPLTPTGLTTRFSVFAEIRIPGSLCPCEMTVEYSLRNASGSVVELAGPVPQPVRVANIVTVESVAGLNLEQKNHIGGRSMNALDFANGMPLSPGDYQFRVTIDGDDAHAAYVNFCVPEQAPNPVLG